MRPSNVRFALNNNTISHNLTLNFQKPTIAEWAGYAGFDGFHLDMEHGVFDWESTEMMCRVADMHGMTYTARISNTENDTILRAFDRGIMGILCPHVDNAEQAQRIANAARFGPDGDRSFGTSRGRDYGMHDMTAAEYMASFNREVTVAIQIETKNAVDTIEDILDVEGIDMIAFGPQDLAQSLGHPGYPEHTEVVEAMDSVVAAVHARGRLMSSDVERGINLVQWLPDQFKSWIADSRSS